MNKSIIIKIAIVLVVLALVYSVFWFFKVGQVEKQVNAFISENSAHVSVGSISVSGFPLSQKITLKDLKFTLPTPLLNKRQTVVRHLEAKAGIFSSDFSVTLVEPVTVQDLDNNSADVQFSKEPEISISISDGRISKFSYVDFGYRIVDMEKNVLYAASSSTANLESIVDDSEKVTTKITANVKDIEGFDVLDIYKNAFEKKVMEGIKTGEIVIGSASSAALTSTTNTAAPAVVPATTTPTPAPAAVANSAAALAPTAAPNASPSQVPVAAADAKPAVNPEEMANAVANNNLVKSNFMISMEYILTPSQTEQAQIPTDPTQIQEAPVQYSKVVKVNSLEFSNPLYKIMINGEMSTFQDDNMPSGALSVKVEKIDTLIGYVASGFQQMAEKKKPTTTEVQSVDLTNNGVPTEDSYQGFLNKVSANLSPVIKELAAKNAVSKEDLAEFDVRREKNLEFLVNETPVREILGKF